MIMFTNTLYDSTWQHTKNFSMKMSLEFFPHYEILQSLFGQSFNLKDYFFKYNESLFH